MRIPALLILVLAGPIACGGYASSSEAFRQSMRRGEPDAALGRVNEALGVERAEQLPSEPEADTPLLLLERATILQAMGRYKDSARDFQAADAKLDVLDLSGDALGALGKYLFSDDATLYKAPAHEKLLLNTMNMINYLALGDASGAKVEARRMIINSKYLQGEGESDARRMMALSSYLAGFAFQSAGDNDQAMRHYADAHAAGGLPTLVDTIKALNAATGATDSRIANLIGEPIAAADTQGTADLLVVVQTGMAPYKYPKRIPILAAVTLTSRGHSRLSDSERRRANTLAAKGLLKWVNYPALKRVRSGHRVQEVALDGRAMPGGSALNVEERVNQQFERIMPSLVAASITRLLARAVAGELSQAAARKGSGDGVLGLLVGLAVEGAMVAADTPDTRGWVTLPAHFHVARARVKAGKRTLQVRYGGVTRDVAVDLPPGGFKLINFSAVR